MKNFLFPLWCSLFLLNSCNVPKPEVSTEDFKKEFSNGKTMKITRTDSIIYSNSLSLFGGPLLDVHKRLQVSFYFEIDPGNCHWQGGNSQIPLNVVFCGEDIYLKIGDDYSPEYYLYYKNRDERYFFNFFGEQRFVPIDSSQYNRTLTVCREDSLGNIW